MDKEQSKPVGELLERRITMDEEQLKLVGELLGRRITMDEEQLKLVGAAFLAGFGASKTGEGVRLPRVRRNRRPSKIHKVPQLPIRLDGDRCPPETVLRFNGRPLHWVWDKTACEGGELSVFSRPEYAYEFRKSAAAVLVKSFIDDSPTAPPSEPPEAPSFATMVSGILPMGGGISLGGDVTLFEHVNLGGASWYFEASWGPIPDFRMVYPTLWWSTNINDKVSSVDNSLLGLNTQGTIHGMVPWAILHEDIYYAGSTLSIAGGLYASGFNPNPQGGPYAAVGTILDVGSFFNDLASSMSYEVTQVA